MGRLWGFFASHYVPLYLCVAVVVARISGTLWTTTDKSISLTISKERQTKSGEQTTTIAKHCRCPCVGGKVLIKILLSSIKPSSSSCSFCRFYDLEQISSRFKCYATQWRRRSVSKKKDNYFGVSNRSWCVIINHQANETRTGGTIAHSPSVGFVWDIIAKRFSFYFHESLR